MKITSVLTFILFLCGSLTLRAQAPVAAIKTDVISGCASLAVVFTDVSTGGAPTAHSWVFPGGTPGTSSAVSQTVVFALPGIYHVTLHSSNASGGSDAAIDITVFPSPIADFTADATTGCFPKAIKFTDKSMGGGVGATVTSWTYDYGDGNIDNGLQNPTHTYTAGGTFPVSLTVKNNYGCQGSQSTKTIPGYINLPTGVIAFFSDMQTQSCSPPITDNFTGSPLSTGPGTLTYAWNFGDGGTSPLPNPSHNFTTVNTYNVALTVTSDQGCADTYTQPVVINASTNVSSFLVPGVVCAGVPVLITNTSTPQPSAAVWSYSDGKPDVASLNDTHTFDVPGPYTITLKNTFPGCSDQVSQTIQAVGPPTPKFTSSNPVSCKAPFTVNFTDQSLNATGWSWDFGDGSPVSTLPNPSHTYASLGQFTVTLTASSASGCSVSTYKQNYVQIVLPVATITNAPAFGCAPYSFTPTYTGVAPDGVAGYHWDFGNGQTYNGTNPPAQTYGVGTFPISVTITSTGGCATTTTSSVKVGTTKPTVAFSGTPLAVCVGKPVAFTDASTGGADQWLWDFGDMTTDPTKSPSHTYAVAGTYNVTLTAYNAGCNATLTKTAYVVASGSTAGFTTTSNCNTLYTFTNTSTNTTVATIYDWDFGDLSAHSNAATPPSHNYPAGPMSYTATLTTTDPGGCSSTFSTVINVNTPSGVLTVDKDPVCPNTTINAKGTPPAGAINFIFYWGDGKSDASGGPQSSHPYAKPGNYPITLTYNDASGCLVTSSAYTLHVNGPTPAFTASKTQGCGTLTTTFTDQSTVNGSTIATWMWDFGDNQISTAQSPTHTYTTQGIYSVKLVVTDVTGCKDSLIKLGYIIYSAPTVDFSADSLQSCPGKPIKFTNKSTLGFNPTYVWNFGNGNTSNLANPPPQFYTTAGKYDVTLTLSDQYGCIIPVTKTQYINIDVPVATFGLSVTSSACPPLVEQFTFTGSYQRAVLYNFQDGGSSNQLNPSHTYTQPGDYYPALTVTSPGGCIANSPTPPQHIHIDGPLGAFTYTPEAACGTLGVTFNVATSNVNTFVWDYGDNTTPVSSTTPTISHTYTVPGVYTPVVSLTDANGCTLTKVGSDKIFIDNIIKTSFTTDKAAVCDNGSVTFSNTSTLSPGTMINTYDWDFGDLTSHDLGATPTHFYGAPGVYTAKLTITTVNGCTDFATMDITVSASPQVDITGAVSQCVPGIENFQGIVLVPDPSPLTWAWDFKNGQTSTLQNPTTQTYPKEGHYVVELTATDAFGCTDAASADLFIYPVPDIFAGADTTICIGTPLQLSASGSANYDWLAPGNSTLSDPNIYNPVANPTTSTSYIVRGFSTYGCQGFDTINVTVNTPVTLTVSGLDSVCIGQSVQLTASGAALYTWTPAATLNNPAIANPLANPVTNTTYQVVGTDSKKCFSDTKTVDVTVFNYPTVNVGPDVTVALGSSYTIPGTGSTDIVSLSWTPTTGLSCTDCLTPVVTPVTLTNYVLKAVNEGGCAATDTVRINVVCNGNNFFIPNTFSPNGDGHNDQFYVQGVGINVIPSITIFNRWGQIVFQKNNFSANVPSDGWDGKINGKPAPPDVYIYTIQLLCDNATLIPFQGNVTLIR